MVIYVSSGCLAFFLMLIFDLNKVKLRNRYLNFSFFLGFLILLLSSLAIVLIDSNIQNWNAWNWVTGSLALAFLILLIYGLFGAIPFKKTYIDYKRNTVVYEGMYALCRHPGVMWFFFFYLLLALTLGSNLMLMAALVWTCMNLIYVYIQDRWIFPMILENYQAYKKEVPFLIPNLASFRSCIHYYWKR